MEIDYISDHLLAPMDLRPWKRPRLAREIPQPQGKALSGVYSGEEVGNVTSHGPPRLHLEHASIFVNGVAQKASPQWRNDDKDGHYTFALGENLTPLYKINRKIGEGTFGQVLECWDRETKEMVAIKVVRSIKKYREAAMVEIDILQLLRQCDRTGSRCVQIHNWSDHRNHICIVFEMLGPSLYDFLQKNNYRPFPVDLVREIGKQPLECVAYVHYLGLIHTDLKPENILFVSQEYVTIPDLKVTSHSPVEGSLRRMLPKSSVIKVIDFGSTVYEHQIDNYIVSTRHYRAPEVILGLGWSYPCDIWSVGCILVELCSGEALFQTNKNLDHLAMMERVLGPLPRHMLVKVDNHAEKHIRRGRLDWPHSATSRESIKAVLKLPRLQNLVMQHVDHSAGDLIDLLQGLLRYDPSTRLTANKALRHPFFTRNHYRRF